VADDADLKGFLAGEDAAFDRLWERARRFLHAYLKNTCCLNSADDREDVISAVALKVLGARACYEYRGIAAWYAFVAKTARWCCMDWYRENGKYGPFGEGEEERLGVPEEDYAPLDTIIEDLGTERIAEQIFHRANVLWLELDGALSPAIHTRQLLAAQYFYLDKLSAQEIYSALFPRMPEEPCLSREELDRWLEHPGVLRYLAYDALYFPDNRLAAYVLKVDDEEELFALVRQGQTSAPEEAAIGGFTWAEVRAILWFYGVFDQENREYKDGRFDYLFERLAERHPFTNQMARICSCLRAVPGVDTRQLLGKPPLWKRLAFQYSYYDRLPHKAIQERTDAAAQQVGFAVPLSTLNGWLSGRKLLKELLGGQAGGLSDE